MQSVPMSLETIGTLSLNKTGAGPGTCPCERVRPHHNPLSLGAGAKIGEVVYLTSSESWRSFI